MTDRLEQLNSLMTKELSNILRRELHNEDKVYLYNLGEYWTAFERSAYQLDQLSKTDPLVLYMDEYPFPIVMCAAHDREVNVLCRKGRKAATHRDYREFVTRPLDPQVYAAWYRHHTEE